MSIGDLPENLSQAMLVGTMLVGRLGVGLAQGSPTWIKRKQHITCMEATDFYFYIPTSLNSIFLSFYDLFLYFHV